MIGGDGGGVVIAGFNTIQWFATPWMCFFLYHGDINQH